ncbi:hypothetical protein BD779DRAFT_1380705, partial [Infundibulicybe gibba]
GKARVPTLTTRDHHGNVKKTAPDNEGKSKMFFEAFFPKKSGTENDYDRYQYPQPKWRFEPITDEQIHRAIDKMKMYKATQPGTIPNCVFKKCKDILVPHLGPIFRATDRLKVYPTHWKLTETPILRKPGKSNYALPNSWRPIALSNGCARLLNACKTEDIVNRCEALNILPKNHFGG